MRDERDAIPFAASLPGMLEQQPLDWLDSAAHRLGSVRVIRTDSRSAPAGPDAHEPSDDPAANAAASSPNDPENDVIAAVELTDGEPGRSTWNLRIAGDRASFESLSEGKQSEAAIRLRMASNTAESIASGSITAQRAFMQGLIHVTGDIDRLSGISGIVVDAGDA
jgi:hypothetical protein